MCNLYSVTTNQEAIRSLFRVERDLAGNLPGLPALFPDSLAPVVRTGPDGVRELAMLRWGMPCPPAYGGVPVTNIRNPKSPHWRPWLKPANRCIVPVTAFCEYADTKPRKTPTWFARDETRPLFAFAGLWCGWTGTRGTKANPVEGAHQLYGFLTTAPNAVVGPVHPKAMPVILTDPADVETWLAAPIEEALRLQRPAVDDALCIVATGEKEDPPRAAPDAAPDLFARTA